MKLKHLLPVAAISLLFTGCSDDDGPNVPLAQEYQVEFIGSSINCFANFYQDGIGGKRVRAYKDNILVNGRPMLYWTSSSSEREFDYSYQAYNTESITFALTLDGDRKFINHVSSEDVSKAEIPEELTEITNNVGVPFEVNAKADEEVSLRLFSLSVTADQKIHNIPVSYDSKSITVSNVPAGNYDMRFIITKTLPLQQQVNNCGGSIKVLSVATRTVKVK